MHGAVIKDTTQAYIEFAFQRLSFHHKQGSLIGLNVRDVSGDAKQGKISIVAVTNFLFEPVLG